MESHYREIPQVSGSPHIPPFSSYVSFTEQVHLGSYMRPELGRTERQHFRGDYHQQSPSPHPYPHPRPYPRPFLHYAHDMHEAVQREIEKERIREEIIMSETIRRRELEAEVMRELMMEKELALRRGQDGFPFASPPVMGFDSPLRLPMVETRGEGMSLEERIIPSHADRERLNGRRESGLIELLPFQRGSAKARISEVKEKEKLFLLTKPSENISGVKRVASGLAAGESPSSRKKAKEEWSCAICQVSTTSEQALNEHLQGKKHKLNEAGLRAQTGGKTYSIGLYPKKAAKATTVDPSSDNEAKVASQCLPLSGENTSKTDNRPLLDESPSSEKVMKNVKPVVAQETQKDRNRLKKKFRFRCEVCQIGCHSPKVLNAHLEGKKHKRRADITSKQNCVVGPCDEKNEAVDENPAEVAGAVVLNESVDHASTKADVDGEPEDSEQPVL